MQCAKHPDHEAAGMCAYSGKPFCSHELVEVQGRMYGKDYLDRVFAEAKEKPAQQIFMAGGASSSAAASTTVVVSARKPLNHALHIILSICTGGLWLLVYLPLLLMRACS